MSLSSILFATPVHDIPQWVRLKRMEISSCSLLWGMSVLICHKCRAGIVLKSGFKRNTGPGVLSKDCFQHLERCILLSRVVFYQYFQMNYWIKISVDMNFYQGERQIWTSKMASSLIISEKNLLKAQYTTRTYFKTTSFIYCFIP